LAAPAKISILAGSVAFALLIPKIGRPAELIVTLAILGRCAYELYGSLRLPSAEFRTGVCSVFMLLGVVVLCFAIALPLESISYVWLTMIAVDLRRLFPRLLPLGGAAAILAIALFARGGIGLPRAGVVWTAIVMSAGAGALISAWVKRKSGVKGFGRGGRAGVLDYFDTFLFAGPAALVALSIAA
jgi:CDP-diglyceride synthetase